MTQRHGWTYVITEVSTYASVVHAVALGAHVRTHDDWIFVEHLTCEHCGMWIGDTEHEDHELRAVSDTHADCRGLIEAQIARPAQIVDGGQLIREAGPYRVDSLALAYGGLHVRPKWPEYGEGWQDRQHDHGGGPGVFSRMGLAEDVEALLNASFEAAAVEAWRADERSHKEYGPPPSKTR